ncbi:hypothetical protein ABKN59_007206 [Abortiporus biennis]
MSHVSNPTQLAADQALVAGDRVCPGCRKTVVTEDGGVVVAFGQSFFHVDCFKCAKCNNQVTADTNLLLLSDGSPVCANCSYCCNVCGEPILDEAIMTGEDSYHAHCFNCKVCKKRIDELVFAKTSQGIYCMDCHNERVARSRRHQQRREKEKAARAAAEAAQANKLREHAVNTVTSTSQSSPEASGSPQNASLNSRSGSLRSQGRPSTPQSNGHSPSAPTSRPMKRVSGSSVGDRPVNSPPQIGHSVSLPISSSAPPPLGPEPSLSSAPNGSTSKRYSSMLMPRPSSPSQHGSSSSDLSVPQQDHLRAATSPIPSRSDTLDVPRDRSSKTLQKRRSYDDRPLNLLLKDASSTTPSEPASNGSELLVPGGTSRKEKRRSINPAVAMSFNSGTSSARSSPIATSFPSHPLGRSDSTQSTNRVNSPLREMFPIDRTLSPPPINSHLNGGLVVTGPQSTDQAGGSINRSRSASASASPVNGELHAPGRPQVRPSLTLDRVPTRTSSRGDHANVHEHSHPAFASDGRRTPGSAEGHSSPVANGAPSLKSQRSFDDRKIARNSTSSLGFGQTIELPARTNSGPTSPSHRADVPRGVESGTDTEAEGEDMIIAGYQDDDSHDLPPLPPPKEDIKDDHSDSGMLDSEDISSEMSHEESSPVERTSHATFIAPALPPIRFSMSGADFSDLLKSVNGGQTLKMEQLAEMPEHGQKPPSQTAKDSSVQSSTTKVSTPTSEITIIGSNESAGLATPVKRREPMTNGTIDVDSTPRRQDLLRTYSPAPIALSSSLPIGSNTARPQTPQGGPKRSIDLTDITPRTAATPPPSETTVPRSSLDTNINRSRSFSGTRVGLPPRPSIGVARPNHRPENETNVGPVSTNASADSQNPSTQITVTPPENAVTKTLRQDTSDLVRRRLHEAVGDATSRGAGHIKLNMEFANAIIAVLDQSRDEYNELKRKLDGMRRASQQYMDGLTVAQTEYDKELKARRDAESEVTRLRVLLSGQAVRLSSISGETKRQEAQKQLSREMSDSLSSLEREISKLKVERDLTLAEVDTLSVSKSSTEFVQDADAAARLSRVLSVRFDSIKGEYAGELIPLTEQRESLLREIAELRASREAFLEETTMLNHRNEELAQLNSQYVRRLEAAGMDPLATQDTRSDGSHEKHEVIAIDKIKISQPALSSSVTSSSIAFSEDAVKVVKPELVEAPTPQFKNKFMKWGSKAVVKEQPSDKVKTGHNFQQVGMLRFARCDHCGEKMFGSQLRCLDCNIAVHSRCVPHVHLSCPQQTASREEHQANPVGPIPPSLFGRDLTEQVRADSRDEQRSIPAIVEKCIDAVDFLGLEYEGIYRKTGGTRMTKVITQLFERGDYTSFDLRDTDQFNDICSITSVLKSYFRGLPDPLLTYNLHDKFISAASSKDPATKASMITEAVNELPHEHYQTTKKLMLHLNRVAEKSEVNLMHARNLGVVFGPTLMRSRDPNAEFSDMAGKALCVEWLVENAPSVFEQTTNQ